MDPPVTYQELLAEQYAENATQLLAFQQTEYNDEATEYEAPQASMTGYAIEDQHLFQQFPGNRNIADDIITPDKFIDNTKLSIRNSKNIKLHTFSIDSRFRAYVSPGVLPINTLNNPANPNALNSFTPTATSVASHFVSRLATPIKNAISAKLSSLELPNTFVNFQQIRGNTIFQMRVNGTSTYHNVDIDPTNIGKYYPTADLLAADIQKAMRALTSVTARATLTCRVDTNTGYMRLGNSSATPGVTYDFNFNYTTPTVFVFDKLAASMGFKLSDTYQNVTLNSGTDLTATYLPDLNTDDYIYLRINDYNTVIPQTVNDTYFSVFSKIIVAVDKQQIIYDNSNTNTTNKTYNFMLPTNIQQLEIQLLDRAGNELIFDGNFSMTIEIEEILSQGLYEKLREL
jgi:hypothetical protein